MRILEHCLKKIYVMLLVLSCVNGTTLMGLGAKRAQIVKEASLEREQKRQAKSAGIDTRSLAEVEEQTTPNKYTQTEAYFQMPKLRKMVTEEFGGSFQPVLYMDMISRFMEKEAQFKDGYWAFYHGTANVWTVIQDVYKELYNHFNPGAIAGKDFIFVRFTDQSGPQAKEFLVEELQTNGLVDDNGKARGLLLSVNFTPFGNTGFKSECTWNYIMDEKKHTEPKQEDYEYIMNKFGVTHKYIGELMALVKLLETKQQTLLQVFVPKDVIDDVGYLAWATGIPAHKETIDWVRTNVKNKVYRGKEGRPGALWALEDLGGMFKTEQEKNPLFKDLLKTVEEGDYSLNSFLKIYCNKPWELPNINYVQARLILSNKVLLNPLSGIKIFRYTTIDPSKMADYKKQLNDIIQKTIAEKIETPSPAAAAAA